MLSYIHEAPRSWDGGIPPNAAAAFITDPGRNTNRYRKVASHQARWPKRGQVFPLLPTPLRVIRPGSLGKRALMDFDGRSSQTHRLHTVLWRWSSALAFRRTCKLARVDEFFIIQRGPARGSFFLFPARPHDPRTRAELGR